MAHWTAAAIPAQNGKKILITGANSGIGFYTALELARAGAHVVLACRDASRGVAAQQLIMQEIPQAHLEVAQLDLSSLAAVRQFAATFGKTTQKLDVLINNAGLMAPQKRLLTQDGFELQWGTNQLGHFALTGLLLPLLQAAPQSRIVTLSSIVHRKAVINFDDLNATQHYNPMQVYGQSKLANAVFGIELQKRLAAHQAPTLSVVAHPGVAKTALSNNSHALAPSWRTWIVVRVVQIFGQTAAQGALPSLYAATAPEVVGGKLYGPHANKGWRGYPVEEAFDAAATADPNLGAKLWNICESMTGVHYLS